MSLATASVTKRAQEFTNNEREKTKQNKTKQNKTSKQINKNTYI